MNHVSQKVLLALVAVIALLVVSCSSDSEETTTTTEDRFAEITYESPGVGIGVFNGVTCDLDSDFKGIITGEDDAGGTIEMILEGDSGTMSINDEWLQVTDAPVTSAEFVEDFALDIVADSVPVRVGVITTEWPACSS